MRLAIRDSCIRCGICIDICPELYDMDYNEDVIRIVVEAVPEPFMDKARESIRDCAVGAIYLTK